MEPRELWSWMIPGEGAWFDVLGHHWPWVSTSRAADIVKAFIAQLPDDYKLDGEIAIHPTATIEKDVVLKAPVIIGPNCFVASHAYLRGGVVLMGNNSIGPGCEIKSSFVFPHSNLAHFNFLGDSIMGSHVNMEAGAIAANHFNEREDKTIFAKVSGMDIPTGTTKFGAMIGNGCKIGANAVLSPGTILEPGRIVGRLELV